MCAIGNGCCLDCWNKMTKEINEGGKQGVKFHNWLFKNAALAHVQWVNSGCQITTQPYMMQCLHTYLNSRKLQMQNLILCSIKHFYCKNTHKKVK